MKVYASESANGSAPPPDVEDSEDDDWSGEDGQYDYSNLFDAPNYADFIKLAPNSKAKSYERRVASLMKAGMVASLNNQQWPDAATFLKYGPGFATAAGNLAAVDARAERIIEMITAPESPYVMFALIAIPMISQLARNHQGDMQEAGASWRERRAAKKQQKLAGEKKPASRIKVHLFGREFTLPIGFKLRMPKLRNMFGAFLAPTQHPQQIAQEVFTDPAVVKALHKMGMYPREAGHETAA